MLLTQRRREAAETGKKLNCLLVIIKVANGYEETNIFLEIPSYSRAT